MGFNRRKFLQLSGGVGVTVAFVPLVPAQTPPRDDANRDEARRWFFLTDAEAVFLAAACDRLIPADEYPSASEAGVVDFIDLQLASAWGEGEGLYLEPPFFPEDALEGQGYQVPYTPAELYRRAIRGIDENLADGPFAQLASDQQDQFLAQLEAGETAAGDIPGNVFFSLLWQNTLEGYFADPVYNGNREMIGWKMIGFPGAHAYYIDTVDDYGSEYFKPPAGIAHRPGGGVVAPFTPATIGRRRG